MIHAHALVSDFASGVRWLVLNCLLLIIAFASAQAADQNVASHPTNVSDEEYLRLLPDIENLSHERGL